MKKLTLIIIGILLVSGVIASIGLSNANTIIPYERDEDTKLTEARMELKETGETKCNALTCWVKVHFTESGRGKTDIITIQGVNKESKEDDIDTAKTKAIKEWSINKAELLINANIKRDAIRDTDTKLGRGNITISVK